MKPGFFRIFPLFAAHYAARLFLPNLIFPVAAHIPDGPHML